MVRVVRPRSLYDKNYHRPVNRAIDSRLVTLPLGQVYLVPRQRIVLAENAQEELHKYRDETFVNRTRMWV